jgi:hypothetical protein
MTYYAKYYNRFTGTDTEIQLQAINWIQATQEATAHETYEVRLYQIVGEK